MITKLQKLKRNSAITIRNEKNKLKMESAITWKLISLCKIEIDH